MKFLILCLSVFVTISSFASFTLPKVQGKLINYTRSLNTELALEITYCLWLHGPSLEHCQQVLETKNIKLNQNGEFIIDEITISGFETVVIEVSIVDLRSNTHVGIDAGYGAGNTELYLGQGDQFSKNYYHDFFKEIVLYDWTNLTIDIATPNGESFQNYANQLFQEKGHQEFMNPADYSWRFTVDSATYRMTRNNNGRYHARDGYFDFRKTAVISTSLLSEQNGKLGCGSSYNLCLVDVKHNADLDHIKLNMGWDHFSAGKKEFSWISGKVYEEVQSYEFSHSIRLEVFKNGFPSIIKTYYLNDSKNEISKIMSDIFVNERTIKLLQPHLVKE